LSCEICGNPIRGVPQVVLVDGAKLRVCNNDAKLGTAIKETVRPQGFVPRPVNSPLFPKFDIIEEELELREDFGTAIKSAREKMGLSQDQLAAKINERASLIRHLETGKMKPDDVLATKLERFLKIDLYGAADRDLEV
jgi:putative transcription factor